MSCYSCKHFAELKKPREFDGYSIYGYCFKRNKFFQEIYHKGYPVFIPESGACNSYKRDKDKHEPGLNQQTTLENVFT